MLKLLVFNLILASVACMSFANQLRAQEFDPDKPDTVIIRSGKAEVTRQLRGKVMRWEGSALTLSIGSRTRQIDGDRVVGVETRWSESVQAGRQQLAINDFSRAIVLLGQAVDEESRPWAQAILRADLIRALLAADQHLDACEHFLILLRDDPNTRFLDMVPLVWVDGPSNPAIVRRAKDWVKSENPTTQLLSASCLIATPQHEEALQKLELLSRDLDQRIANLATAQIWRAQQNVDFRLIEKWIEKVSSMQKALRPGPYFVLADQLESVGRHDQAVTTWMRLPILHQQRPDLAAAALYRVARLLHNTDSNESAALALQELTRTYPNSAWAQRASRLK